MDVSSQRAISLQQQEFEMSADKTVTAEVEALLVNAEIIEMSQELPADVDTSTIEFSMHADAEAEDREVFASPGSVAQAINILLGK